MNTDFFFLVVEAALNLYAELMCSLSGELREYKKHPCNPCLSVASFFRVN